jgi:protocatechuate 3,4-dioxygenase beta subunit
MEAIGTAAPAVAPTDETAVATALPAITATTVATSVPIALPATQAAAAPQPPATCSPGALTPAMTEGPYYKANPPEASTLSNPSNSGTKLTITGYVFDASCKPLTGARVDFWQADAAGQYDNSGYTLRGYVLTDSAGLYSVTAVVPGLYPGRTRHIHVKVTPPNGKTLTTQLFFPDEPANSRDSIFSARNVLAIRQAGDGEEATFNFVVGQ